MAEIYVRRSPCVFARVIFALLLISVDVNALSIKDQLEQQNKLKFGVDHDKLLPFPKGFTDTPSPHGAPKSLATRSVSRETDIDQTAENSITVSSPWEYFRLPKYVIPLHYDLLLHPDVSNDTFTGSVNITVNVTRNTNVFIVHAYELDIKDCRIFEYKAGSEIGVARSFLYDPHEYFVVETERTAEPGIYNLSYKFLGSLVGNTVGFYKSTYMDQNNQTKYLVTSNFQPTYARRAFPYFDEPSFKATFTISLVHELGYKALSNMPVCCTKSYLDTQLLITKFQTSMKMPTYLAYFIVNDFDYMCITTSTGKEFCVYATSDRINQMRYALTFGSKVLEFLENYFGVDYPLSKQNLVAVPGLTSDDMAHWGITPFRESDLLYDQKSSSLQKKQWIATAIAHEMAHMWFGNLITMEWWDDLWLNEGFASYFKYKGVQAQHTKWDILSSFVTEDMQPVMNFDSAMCSRAIVQPVRDQDEITEMFDDISYKKGASVLRMLEFFVGKDNFQRGVSQFLTKYQFKNVKTADLWEELSKIYEFQGNHSIASVMKTWTEQMGFPFITVRRLRCTENACVFLAKQERYIKNETLYSQSSDSSKKYVWSVPLSYVTEDGKTDIVWIHDQEEMEFVVPMEEKSWIKFNVNQTGYFLVNYEKEEWDKLTEILMTNHEEFSSLDRANLLFDSFSLANAGHLDYEIPLKMTFYLRKETYYGAWRTALNFLDQIKRYFEKEELIQDIIKEHIRSLAKNLDPTITGDYLQKKLGRILLDTACNNGHHDCLIKAGDLFNQWKKGVPLDPEIRGLVYMYGLQALNDEDSWVFLWQNYISETDPDVKADLLEALSNYDTRVEKFMEAARNESFVKKHDYFRILQSVAQNKQGFSLVTELIFNNWTDLVKNYGTRETENFVYSVFKRYDSVDDLNKVREFYRKNKVTTGGQRSRTLAIGNILDNIRWLESHKTRVTEWFENSVYMPWRNMRLPTHIAPTKYNITLRPNITKEVFEGEEEVTITISEATNYMLVHEEGMKISHTELKSLKSGEAIPIDEKFPYQRNNFYVIIFKETVQEGEYTLKLRFTGIFFRRTGLKRYEYQHSGDSSIRYLIATKLEPLGARRMLPCFDEPAFKATFKLTLIHEDNYTVLSNMPVEVEIPLTGSMVKTVFQETVNMSTYLLCFVMSDFDYIEREYRGKKVRAYAAPDKIGDAEVGLNLTIKFLKFYEEYLDVPYDLPKLDSVAVPHFVTMGMEHWGAITYLEAAFLDERHALNDIQVMAIDKIIAHETAHQWFGNLVTMKWWNDIWLNEGITTFMNFQPIREYYPTIDLIDVKLMADVMCRDSLLNSVPIIRDLNSIPEIRKHTTSKLVYRKGCALTRMLRYILKDDFRKGISNFLKKYAYKNAETKDLWEELSKASSMKLNIAEIMDPWTLQKGFPYVELQRNGSTLKATQRWFVQHENDSAVALLTEKAEYSPFGFMWKIPLAYKNLATGKEHILWLNNKTTYFKINASEDDVLKFNPGFFAYYLVKYDEDDYQRIVKLLQTNHTILSVTDRFNLLHEAFVLAKSDRLPYDVFLEFSKYFKKEKERRIWKILREGFVLFLNHMDRNSETVKLLKKYARHLTADFYDEIASSRNDTEYLQELFDPPPSCFHMDPDHTFTEIITDLACQSGNEKCMETMNNELSLWIQRNNITIELRSMFTFVIPRTTNNTMWDVLYERVAETNDTYDRGVILDGLAAFTGREEIMKSIEVMMQDPSVDSELAYRMFHSLGRNPVARPILWNYVKSNWESLLKRLNYPITIQTYRKERISDFCSDFKSLKDLEDFTEFLKSVPQFEKEFGKEEMEECVQRIQDAANWIEKHERTIQSWLRQNVT